MIIMMIYIFLAVITQSYVAVPKNIKLNLTHFFLIKTLNKPEIPESPTKY